jgi:hypothetical protein
MACSGPGAEEDKAAQGSADEFNGDLDETGNDVQTLQVWTAGRMYPQLQQFSPGLYLDATNPAVCPTLREVPELPGWEARQVDCTKAFSDGAASHYQGKAGPVFTPMTFTVTKRVGGNESAVDPDGCGHLELRLVLRDAASSQPSFAGVGFSTSYGERFIPKGELQAVGQTKLKGGDPVTVYRFSGIGTCYSSAHSSTSGNLYRTFRFKPYAAFDGQRADGSTVRYRKWEAVQGDHVLGRSWPGREPVINSDGFNREKDLLAP